MAASQVNVTDAVTGFDELNDGLVRDRGTVAKMDIVQVLPKFGNRQDCTICDTPAFCQHEVPQAWG
jgi:hypothetical protein